MPEFILPAEADHCPHCGQVLRDPPNCCQKMMDEYSAEFMRQLQEQADDFDTERELDAKARLKAGELEVDPGWENEAYYG